MIKYIISIKVNGIKVCPADACLLLYQPIMRGAASKGDFGYTQQVYSYLKSLHDHGCIQESLLIGSVTSDNIACVLWALGIVDLSTVDHLDVYNVCRSTGICELLESRLPPFENEVFLDRVERWLRTNNILELYSHRDKITTVEKRYGPTIMLQVAMEFSSEDTIRTLLTILPRLSHKIISHCALCSERPEIIQRYVSRPYCGIMYCGPRGLAALIERFKLRLTPHMIVNLLYVENYNLSCVYYLAKRNLDATVDALGTLSQNIERIVERVKYEKSKTSHSFSTVTQSKKRRRK